MFELEELEVLHPDGAATRLTVFRAEGSDRPVVLCLPALGVTASYYEVLGECLAEAGYHAVLMDHRGNGGSSVRPSRCVSFGYREMLEIELPTVVEAICSELGVERVIVLGHSLGGPLALMHAATSDRVSHTVSVASGSGYFAKVRGIRSVGRLLGLHLMLATTALWGYLPAWFPFGGTEARGVVRDFLHEALTGRYRIAGSRRDYEALLRTSRVPALFVSLTGDTFVGERCTNHLASKLTAASVTRVELGPEAYGMREPHHFRWAARPRAVVTALSDWLGPANHARTSVACA